MAYTGATNPTIGTDTGDTLTRDVQLDVLDAYTRALKAAPLVYTKQIPLGASGGQFIIEGKEDTDDVNIAQYARGTQIDVTNGTVDEIIINLDRPQYIARRLDSFEIAITNYPAVSMNVRQVGAKLASSVDRKILATIEASSLTAGTNNVNNGGGTVVTLPAPISSYPNAEARGDILCEALYAGVAALRANDDTNEIFCFLNPNYYSYIVQSGRAVNTDYTTSNGGFEMGKVYQVGGAVIEWTNNMPTTAGLIALMFTYQAAGIVELWGIKTETENQIEFLNALLILSYYSNGMGVVRPQSAVSIKDGEEEEG
jgi:hypothetical protein